MFSMGDKFFVAVRNEDGCLAFSVELDLTQYKNGLNLDEYDEIENVLCDLLVPGKYIRTTSQEMVVKEDA